MIRGQPRDAPVLQRAARYASGCCVAAIVVAAATLFNVAQMLRYSRSDTELARQASQRRGAGRGAAPRQRRLRASVDSKQIERASLEARQANELIDRRTFSWTALFNEFEATLPPNVRITSFRPRIDPRRGNVVTISLVARGVDDVQLFMENLEKTGSFPEICPAVRAHQRTRPARDGHRNGVRAATGRQGGRAAGAGTRRAGPVTTLARRIFAEKRHLVLPLGIAIVANVLLYALVVYPLAIRSAGAADRAAAAAQQRIAAERELQVARGLIAGKAEAEEELSAFYKKVLPANVSAARSLTYVPVIEIARRNDVNYVNRVYEDPEELHRKTAGGSASRSNVLPLGSCSRATTKASGRSSTSSNRRRSSS